MQLPFPKSDISIVSKAGQIRSTTKAIITKDLAIIEDAKAQIEVGDEIRRLLPNGLEEAFTVVDPTFYERGVGPMGAHYQVKMARKGSFPAHTGGNYNVSVSGPNARVNISSQDNSVNNVVGTEFASLGAALQQGIKDAVERERLLGLMREMEKEKGGAGFAQSYQRFIAAAGDHMKIVGPFIPLLSKFF